MHTAKTVFVDRDGVINVNKPAYVKCWQEFEFLPRSLAALALLADHGLDVVVVTNQSAVNRGLISRESLAEIHDRMCEAITNHGGRVKAVLYCPHRPDEGCTCRKPRPGLLDQARRWLGVDPSAAVLVGDHPADLEAARQAGCRSMLVLSGRTNHWTSGRLPGGCIGVVPDLSAAAARIVTDFAAPFRSLGGWPVVDSSAPAPDSDGVLEMVGS